MDEAQYLSLPDNQRKEFQKKLQAQGLYVGPIDGLSGKGMKAAFTALDRSQKDQSQADLKKQELDLQRMKLEQEGRAADQQRQRQQSREDSSDPLMQRALPFGAGAVAGGVYGEMANRGLDRFEKGNVRALNEIAKELGPTSKMTSSQMNRSRAVGAAKAAERFAPATGAAKAAAVTGRALSYGIPAAAIFNEYERYKAQAEDPNASDKDRAASQAIANGLLGSGTGIAVEGGRRFFFPPRDPGIGTAMMRVEAARDLARRFDAKDAPQPSAAELGRPSAPSRALSAQTIDAEVVPPEPTPAKALPAPPAEPDTATKTRSEPLPGTKADLAAQAKRLGVKGYTTMNKETLAKEVAAKIAEHGGKRTRASGGGKAGLLGPLVAAGTTYLAQGDQAEASDGSAPSQSLPEQLAAPAAAAGGTYLTGKALQAIGTAGRAAGGMMEPIAGMGIDPLEGGSRAETAQRIAQGRADMSYNMPWVSEKVLGIPRAEGAGYPITQDAANLPMRNPQRMAPSPGNQYFPLSGQALGQPSQPARPPAGAPLNPDFLAALNELTATFQGAQ